MKCPCCGEQTDRELIIVGNRLYKADGVSVKFLPRPLEYFQVLLYNEYLMRPVLTPKRAAMDVHISKLRQFISENNLPFTIKTMDTKYSMERHRS